MKYQSLFYSKKFKNKYKNHKMQVMTSLNRSKTIIFEGVESLKYLDSVFVYLHLFVVLKLF